jgi:hypothetical protein
MLGEFETMNVGVFPVLKTIRLDENVLRRISNPIKD